MNSTTVSLLKEQNALQEALDALLDRQLAGEAAYCLAKYFRSEENNLFYYTDLALLQKLVQADLPSVIHQWLVKVLDDFNLTMQTRFDHVTQLLMEQIRDCEEALYDFDPSVTIQGVQQKLIFACHDLYWDFHNPFGFGIDSTHWPLFKEQFPGAQDRFTLFERLLPTIESYGNGVKYRQLFDESIWQHKIQYLQAKRNELSPSRVAIFGGGVAGLMRLLAGWLGGVDVRLYEKEDPQFSHPNVLKIRLLPMLDYLGIRDWLLLRQKIYNFASPIICVMPQDLNSALRAVIHALGASTSLQAGFEFKGIDAKGVDIQGKKNFKDTPAIVVDATGIGAIVAEALGNKAQRLTGESLVVVAMFDDVVAIRNGDDEYTTRALKQFALATPECRCELILPHKEVQQTLMQLQDTGKHEEAKRLVRKIALEAAEDDPDLDHTHAINESQIRSVAAYRIALVQRRCAQIVGNIFVQQSGDSIATADPLAAIGTTTALKGATIFSKSIELTHLPLENQLEAFVFATCRQTKTLLQKSLKARQ